MSASPAYILGVDPGLHGACALYDVEANRLVDVIDMPTNGHGVDALELGRAICGYSNWDLVALVEDVHSRPRQAGAFAFGLYTGIVHGVLGALEIPVVKVAPSYWKPAMGLTCLATEQATGTKDRARSLAQHLWPESAESFARKKDDGRAEAALIARFGAMKGIDSLRKRNQKTKR